MMVEDKTFLSAVAITIVGILEAVALVTGHDGQYLIAIVGVISALAGYNLAQQESIKALGKAAGSPLVMPTEVKNVN